ncbi:MAG: flavin-containing monooxygenase [Gemmatimonadales bacterium]
MDSSSLPYRVAIVGAGSSGLAAAKNFREAGFQVEILEREPDLGGNWNYGQTSARVYRSTHTISSKPGTEYPDFPMPREFPDYPHHAQILAYLRAYAEHFDLLGQVRLGANVKRVAPVAERDPLTRWSVELADGGKQSYDVVVLANGHHEVPRYPDYQGQFTGHSLHSAEYKTPDLFTGKRVLVIGGGNSGCDIVVEAAQFAERAWHSTRRAYWYMPKYLFGRPADQVGDFMLALRVPLWLRRASATVLHRLLVGSPQRTGLPKPDHRLFETHPIVNSLLPYYVGQGDITPVPDVARFEGPMAHFADGRSAEVDVVVFATGYVIAFPFIEPHHLNWQNGRPALYLNVFHPMYDTLFAAGLIQPDSGQFGLVHWQTRASARYARAALTGSPAAAGLRRRKAEPNEGVGGGVRYKDSPRHYLEVEHWSYQRKLMGWAGRLQ